MEFGQALLDSSFPKISFEFGLLLEHRLLVVVHPLVQKIDCFKIFIIILLQLSFIKNTRKILSLMVLWLVQL